MDNRVGTLDIEVRLGYAKNVPETFRVSLDFESCVLISLKLKPAEGELLRTSGT